LSEKSRGADDQIKCRKPSPARAPWRACPSIPRQYRGPRRATADGWRDRVESDPRRGRRRRRWATEPALQSALSLPVTTTQQGVSQTITSSSVNATMNPNTTLLISMGDKVASTVVGWADVLSSGALGGYAIFRSTPQTGSPSEGTVPLQSQFPSTVTLPYDNTAGFVWAWLWRICQRHPQTSQRRCGTTAAISSARRRSRLLATATLRSFCRRSFPLTAGRRGIVKFQSAATGGLTGLGLRFSPFGTFTSVLVVDAQARVAIRSRGLQEFAQRPDLRRDPEAATNRSTQH
jgi:hypothetical protein